MDEEMVLYESKKHNYGSALVPISHFEDGNQTINSLIERGYTVVESEHNIILIDPVLKVIN